MMTSPISRLILSDLSPESDTGEMASNVFRNHSSSLGHLRSETFLHTCVFKSDVDEFLDFFTFIFASDRNLMNKKKKNSPINLVLNAR